MTDDSGRESREPARMTVERVRSLLEAATPGPWDLRNDGLVITEGDGEPVTHVSAAASLDPAAARRQAMADAALIAAAPDIARAYLAAREALDTAYARGALDMRTRADCVAAYKRGALDMRTRAAAGLRASEVLDPRSTKLAVDVIEALDVEAPQ